ncbi:uncharacterized protein LOC143176704 [Nomia melanderi]|uniref:uncharacterized protein LOC143176704 n=1 Tax=Nomia melanderi TaxID=2448451 RepID=UPI003FCDBDE0
MATRSKAAAAEQPSNADELAIRQRHLNDKEKRLREEQTALEMERENALALMNDYEKFRAENADLRRILQDEREQNRAALSESNDTRTEIENLRRLIEDMRHSPKQRASNRSPFPSHGETETMPVGIVPENHSFGLREALETVPIFDGSNIPVLQFSRACRRAREIISPTAERSLTKLILTKLRGRAYAAVEDENPCTVSELCNRLKTIFGPRHSVDHYRGELANIYMRPNEHILDYIGRVKDLKSAISGASRDTVPMREIDSLSIDSFISGLIPTLRTELRISRLHNLSDIFDEAINLYKQHEVDKERYSDRHVRFQNQVISPSSHGRANERDYFAQTFRPAGRDYLAQTSRPAERDHITQTFPAAERAYVTRSPRPVPRDYVTQTSRPVDFAYRNQTFPTAERDFITRSPRPVRREFFDTQTSRPVSSDYHNRDSRPVPRDRYRDGTTVHDSTRRDISHMEIREPRRLNSRAYSPEPSSTSRPKFCNYCKFSGHDIHECRKREANNRRSGNDEPLPSTSNNRREETRRSSIRAMSDATLDSVSDKST